MSVFCLEGGERGELTLCNRISPWHPSGRYNPETLSSGPSSTPSAANLFNSCPAAIPLATTNHCGPNASSD